MLREEVKQVYEIAQSVSSESVGAAVSVISAKIAEIEVKLKRLSDTVDRLSKPKLKGGLE